MIPLVIAVLVVALGYFLYTKYITPPFVEDAGDIASEAVLPAASFSASSTQTSDFANLAKSPMIVDPKRPIAAQQVPSATHTALSSPSTTTAIASPSIINAKLPLPAAENVLPSSTAVLQANLDQLMETAKKLVGQLKSAMFADDFREMLSIAPLESKSLGPDAEKASAVGMPASSSPGLGRQMDPMDDNASVSSSESNVEVNYNLDDYLVKDAPATIHYIPEFISEEQEQLLLDKIDNAPKPKWINLSNRRLQQWGGMISKKGCLVSDGPLPFWLKMPIDKICKLSGASGNPSSASFPSTNRPNHVLVNEYTPGQGIMPHSDGPVFFPLVSTLSLGGHVLLDLYEHVPAESASNDQQQKMDQVGEHRHCLGSIFLEPRSLILIRDEAYSKLLHGIEERVVDELSGKKVFNGVELSARTGIQAGMELERSTRVSLTIRNVPVVNKGLVKALMGRNVKQWLQSDQNR